MLTGLYVLLFVGGLLADEQYNVYAASGDTELDLPVAAEVAPTPAPAEPNPPAAAEGNSGAVAQADPVVADPPVPSIAGPSRFDVPFLNNNSSELTNAAPPMQFGSDPSTVSRIVIPAIALDKKVVQVGYAVQQNDDGQPIAVWDVDKYRVGHHQGTSNPGDGSNIVLAGHSGGAAYPFNDIYWLEPGHVIQLTSNDQIYDYTVTERLVVDEDGQPWEKRQENARYMDPTDQEMVTMITCWPLVDQPGIPKFSQRVIVRAQPATPETTVAQPATAGEDGTVDTWIAR